MGYMQFNPCGESLHGECCIVAPERERLHPKAPIPKAQVGVVIGRFQVARLHPAHKALINTAAHHHRKVLVLLGVAPLGSTINNPLDFEARALMIKAEFPHVTVLPIQDINNDAAWSAEVDKMIGMTTTCEQTAVLYGSRDSFIPRYLGRYQTIELEPYVERDEAGRNYREMVREEVMGSEDFRRGVIWSTGNRYTTCYAAVDVALLNGDMSEVLLGRKPHRTQFQFIGGFADVGSTSFEADARREAMEEAGVELESLDYISSSLIDDWRYRFERDKIKSLFFAGTVKRDDLNPPRAGDDIEEIQWFDVYGLSHDGGYEDIVLPSHHDLFRELTAYIDRKS